MKTLSRRELLGTAALALTPARRTFAQTTPIPDWIRSARILNAEGYNPPFYPAYTYDPERAVRIARDLNADTFRYPAASYYALFPTKTKYPVHPELRGDPMKQTLALCRKNNLHTVAYIPLNHPFMDVKATNSNYRQWMRLDAHEQPLVTSHYGFGRYYEGCLNSPLRDEIFALVREVLTFDFDLIYFDGPYQGMEKDRTFCHCRWCRDAYRKAHHREIPREDGPLEDVLPYTLWLRDEVCMGTLEGIVKLIKETRGLPVLYNNTSLLASRGWRSRSFAVTDGFMFEAADTPEQKLCNLQLGQSTGKAIWTYVGHHTQYNRQHLTDNSVRGWYAYPVDHDELLMDGATALTAGAGMVFWSLARLHSMPGAPTGYDEGKNVSAVFQLAEKHQTMLRSARSVPQAGIVVGAQTIDWYAGKMFVRGAYGNGFRGAWQVMKDMSIDAEPVLDFKLTPEHLHRYPLWYVPSAACLSEQQCRDLIAYVQEGGILIATHMTGVCDEYGRRLEHPQLHDLFGIRFTAPEPIERPDLYLKVSGRAGLIPQDPQITRFEALPGTEVFATTFDVARQEDLGPAITRKKHGRGEVIYIGSSLEAVYEETDMPEIRDFLISILEPRIGQSRSYRIPSIPGLMAHMLESSDKLYLHLLADTGNKSKVVRARESYLPLSGIDVQIRVPSGKKVQALSFMRSNQNPRSTTSGDWLKVTVPRVYMHECIIAELS